MKWAKNLVDKPWFGHTVTIVIIINAVVIGLDTSTPWPRNMVLRFAQQTCSFSPCSSSRR